MEQEKYFQNSLHTFNLDNHQPLVAEYSREEIDKSSLLSRRHDMWRYEEMLPVLDPNIFAHSEKA